MFEMHVRFSERECVASSEFYVDWNDNLAAIFEAKLKAAIEGPNAQLFDFSFGIIATCVNTLCVRFHI